MNPVARDQYQAPIAEGAKTRVLILGTPHLSNLGGQFNPALLDSLMLRLRGFAPDAIALESIPPRVLQNLVYAQETYQPILEAFAAERLELAQVAQTILGLSRDAAEREASNVVIHSDADRLRLVQLLLAAFDDLNAQLHWERLAPASRQLPTAMTGVLDRRITDPDERFSIGVKLGLELGQERLFYIDDHHDADLHFKHEEQIEREWNDSKLAETLATMPGLVNSKRVRTQALEHNDLLPYYEFVNSPESMLENIDLEEGLYLRLNWSSGLHRLKVAQWELRNLLMAAHIRRVTADYPGGAVLVIVGSSHKALLDTYLGRGSDLRLVHLHELV